VNPVRKDKLNTMFKEKYALVNTILLGYLSDYNAKSTALRGMLRVVTINDGEMIGVFEG
jgi:hypothetical protein